VTCLFKPPKTLTTPSVSALTNIVWIRLARIGRLFLFFLFLAHWIGCFWWALGVMELSEYPNEDRLLGSWLHRPNFVRPRPALSPPHPLSLSLLSPFADS
jgi:hypothetical protein